MSALPTLVFPDAVEIVLEQVAQQLGLPTGTKVPNPRPDSFVLARRTGSSRVTMVTEAVSIAVECWAGSPGDADDLAQRVSALVHAMQGGTYSNVPIYRVSDVGGPRDQPDELSDQPRSTFTLEVHVRGKQQP